MRRVVDSDVDTSAMMLTAVETWPEVGEPPSAVRTNGPKVFRMGVTAAPPDDSSW